MSNGKNKVAVGTESEPRGQHGATNEAAGTEYEPRGPRIANKVAAGTESVPTGPNRVTKVATGTFFVLDTFHTMFPHPIDDNCVYHHDTHRVSAPDRR